MRKIAGFTLVELLVVVAIIGILSAISLPYYRDYVRSGKLPEAYTTLSDMRVRMELYFQDNPGTGYGPTAGPNGCNDPVIAGYVAGTGVKNFTYTCLVGSSTTFTVTAAGKASEGVGGFTFTLNEQNQRATTSVPTGWATNATCWIRKKGGVC